MFFIIILYEIFEYCCGIFFSATTTLGSGASETLTITNSRCVAATDVVLVSMATGCTGGFVSVSSVVAGVGTFDVTVYNAGGAACSTVYAIVSLLVIVFLI